MEPGPLIASGRDGDIFEFGPGLVLRRTRTGRSIEHEARIIEYMTQQGYPVPAIHEVRANGTEIVMERIDGPMMLDVGKSAVKLASMLRLLADLHDRLHRIPAPDWLPQYADGDRVLHLDLHPLNVIMSPARGPVVIDWSNAHRGDPLADVAVTYVLLTCPSVPVPLPIEIVFNLVRVPFANRAFASRYRGIAFDRQVATMAELKTLDLHMSAREVARMQKLAAKMRAKIGARAPG